MEEGKKKGNGGALQNPGRSQCEVGGRTVVGSYSWRKLWHEEKRRRLLGGQTLKRSAKRRVRRHRANLLPAGRLEKAALYWETPEKKGEGARREIGVQRVVVGRVGLLTKRRQNRCVCLSSNCLKREKKERETPSVVIRPDRGQKHRWPSTPSLQAAGNTGGVGEE